MILYALVSGAHERLLRERFLPSVRRWDEYDLHIEQVPPAALAGAAGPTVAHAVRAHKAALMLRAIEENWGKCFVFSDVDVVFLRPTREWLLARVEGYDVCTQQGRQPHDTSTGFMVTRANEATRRLWARMQRRLVARPEMHDASVFSSLLAPGMLPCWLFGRPLQRVNRALAGAGLVSAVRHHSLPHSVFHIGMTPGYQSSWQRELPGEDAIEYPAGVRIVHAAFTTGIDNKLELLRRATERASGKRGPGPANVPEAGPV